MSSINIIETLYSAFRDKDYDAFRALCSKDIEWIQNKGFPKGGHYHGADAVIKNVFQQLKKTGPISNIRLKRCSNPKTAPELSWWELIWENINRRPKP